MVWCLSNATCHACLQYRERLLVSPAPIIRPTMGREWSLQHVELFPPRPADATAAMRDAFRCFLHVTLFSTDRMGRPVSHPVHAGLQVS